MLSDQELFHDLYQPTKNNQKWCRLNKKTKYHLWQNYMLNVMEKMYTDEITVSGQNVYTQILGT